MLTIAQQQHMVTLQNHPEFGRFAVDPAILAPGATRRKVRFTYTFSGKIVVEEVKPNGEVVKPEV